LRSQIGDCISFAEIFTIIIIAVDFVISIWDAYAGGFSLGMLKKTNDKSKFKKASAISAVGLGFVGSVYVIATVLGFAAAWLGYISFATLEFILSFNLVFLGILIIGFGLIITIQSIIIAAQRRNAWSILIAVYNSFALGFDIWMYVSAFKESAGIITRSTRRSQGSGLVVIIVAVLIAFIIVHAAYKHGYKKGLNGMQGKAGAMHSRA
jgi:hypothetical protein